jgi:ribulose-phosphate 3-epimerase
MQVIPTILEKSFDEAKDRILRLKDQVKWIQIDVIDGYFSFGKTFELELLTKVEGSENILWETHLMVKEPINWIKKSMFINCSRIIGQVEMMSNRSDFIKKVKDNNVEAGLAFDIDTEVTDDIPEETDVILLLSRKSGFESQPFEEKVYEKIEKLVEIRKNNQLNFRIGIDGGVNEENIGILKNKGVEIAYCGGSVFGGKVEDNLKKLNYASKN